MKKTTLALSLLTLVFVCPSTLFAKGFFSLDSASLSKDETRVQVKTSGGVPIGTIIAWPMETDPAEINKWLECNGQEFDPELYPELAKILACSKTDTEKCSTPNYSGVFLRGYGKQTHTQSLLSG